MAHKSIYLRKGLEKPLEKYSKDNEMQEGTAINVLLHKQLKKEGYL